jgi:hypothetical protein
MRTRDERDQQPAPVTRSTTGDDLCSILGQDTPVVPVRSLYAVSRFSAPMSGGTRRTRVGLNLLAVLPNLVHKAVVDPDHTRPLLQRRANPNLRDYNGAPRARMEANLPLPDLPPPGIVWVVRPSLATPRILYPGLVRHVTFVRIFRRRGWLSIIAPAGPRAGTASLIIAPWLAVGFFVTLVFLGDTDLIEVVPDVAGGAAILAPAIATLDPIHGADANLGSPKTVVVIDQDSQQVYDGPSKVLG